MERLTILFDPSCGFCRHCVEWLRAQPGYLELEFLPGDSELARSRFPELDPVRPRTELTVVDDMGGVYLGEDAYLICLYALQEYRDWAIRLNSPINRPFVRTALGAVTRYRRTLSELFTRP